MSKKIYVRDLVQGYTVEDDIKSGGRILVKKGTVLTSSLATRLRNWFKNTDDCITVSEEDCITATNHDVNMTTCISPELEKKTLESLKNLYEVNPKDFKVALTPVKNCVRQVADEIKRATNMCYEIREFKEPDADQMEEHLFRVAKLTIALANVYNNSVPVSAEINLADIGLATLLHDYGKTFKDRPAELRRLRPDGALFKKLNLHPQVLQKPYMQEIQSVYAYLAMEDTLSEKCRKMLLFSGLCNYTINKLDRYCPEARAAKIIALCHLYDELLEIVIHNKMTLPLENVIPVIAHGVENGDISKSMYKLFMDNIQIYAPGTKVILTTGEFATVVGNTSHFPTKPMVFTDNSMGTPRLLNLSETTTITIKQILTGRNNTSGKVSQIQNTQLTKIVTP